MYRPGISAPAARFDRGSFPMLRSRPCKPKFGVRPCALHALRSVISAERVGDSATYSYQFQIGSMFQSGTIPRLVWASYNLPQMAVEVVRVSRMMVKRSGLARVLKTINKRQSQ